MLMASDREAGRGQCSGAGGGCPLAALSGLSALAARGWGPEAFPLPCSRQRGPGSRGSCEPRPACFPHTLHLHSRDLLPWSHQSASQSPSPGLDLSFLQRTSSNISLMGTFQKGVCVCMCVHVFMCVRVGGVCVSSKNTLQS